MAGKIICSTFAVASLKKRAWRYQKSSLKGLHKTANRHPVVGAHVDVGQKDGVGIPLGGVGVVGCFVIETTVHLADEPGEVFWVVNLVILLAPVSVGCVVAAHFHDLPKAFCFCIPLSV